MPPEAPALSSAAIKEGSSELGLQLAPDQCERLASFAALLVKWNRVHNLTALDRPSDVLTHHLLDSLAIVPELVRGPAGRTPRILDVGSGGGLPGIPIAIALPEAHVTLIDRVQKKTAFLQQVRVELALPNVEVVHARVEQFKAPPFDIVVSRAFASLAEMVRLTRHLVAPGGIWAAMKGVLPRAEMDALPPTVEAVRAVKLRVPLLGAERHLVILRPR